MVLPPDIYICTTATIVSRHAWHPIFFPIVNMVVHDAWQDASHGSLHIITICYYGICVAFK